MERHKLVGRRKAIGVLGCASLGGLVPTLVEASLKPGLCGATDVDGFIPHCFVDSKGVSHQLYVVGSGPPVLLLHELPGLVVEDLEAARRIASFGYSVVAPLFFGKPGLKTSGWTTTLNSFRVCDRREFACSSRTSSSPHVLWLRELIGELRTQWKDGASMAVVGMCLTGAFPVALLQDPVGAAVVCQPTLPIHAFSRFGWFTDKSGLGISAEDLARAKNASQAPILGIRYTRDWRCPPQRFERLTREFGNRFFRMDLVGNAHSSLASACRPETLDEVISFLDTYVRRSHDPATPAFPRHSRPNSTGPVLVTPSPLPCQPHHG